jgi:hypothetical protein
VVFAGHRRGNVEVLQDVDRVDGVKLFLLLVKLASELQTRAENLQQQQFPKP